MPTDPLWLPSISYDETELRKMDSPLVMADGTALGSRPGIRPGDPGLTVTLSGTTVNISTGVATLYRPGQGVYRAFLAATSPGTLTAANASFSRIDLVYLRVWDTAVDSSGLRRADAVLLTGTASATPVVPTPGATEIYIPLATITVPSTGAGGTGAATVSTAVRQITVAPGGILPVSSPTDIASAGSYVGQARFNTTRLVPEYWTGTAWTGQGDWSSFTPTWTASTINPILGNGTLTSRWTRVGRQITWIGLMSAGSTTNGGNGVWAMSLPTPSAANGVVTVGSANYFNQGDNDYVGVCQINSASSVLTFSVKTASSSSSYGNVSNSAPVAAGSTSNLRWTIVYEAAG
ncbi:hypothetical protein P3T27_006490 [Kitasatospora sp. MAA19]|uniref:hypothetical protein n=1 Tax=Kitasatospora sp. MAA19 TaxID=3035090 RepID=UPI002473D72C|nr:hypothetical protein [Kitasatospora sp. MAA19]MDH6709741.1 hypothetical protein [Kitasatospora sp. MAA19]